MKFLIEPIERGADIVQFPVTVIMRSLAESGAAKIKPQYRKAKMIQRLHRMEDDFIVQRSTINRMRMADQRGVLRAARAFI